VQARFRAVGDHLVEITSASGAPCRRVLEREGRAPASAAAAAASCKIVAKYKIPQGSLKWTKVPCGKKSHNENCGALVVYHKIIPLWEMQRAEGNPATASFFFLI